MTNRSIAFVAMLSVSASILGVITPLQAQVETEKSSDLASGLTLIPTDANIIVYREYAEPIIWASTVKVDGEKVAALTNRRFTAMRVPPGQHTLTISWSRLAGQPPVSLDISVSEGERRFFEITGNSKFAGLGPGILGSIAMYINMSAGISEVKPEHANQVLSNCCKFKTPNQR